MNNRRKRIVASLFLVTTMISSVFFAPSVMAESDMAVMRHELLMNSLYGCYDNDHMNTFLDSGLGAQTTFKDLDDVFKEPKIGNAGSSYYEPTLSQAEARDIEALDCKTAIEKLLGQIPSEKDVKARQDYLAKLGYTAVPGRNPNVDYNVGCINIEYDANGQHYVAGEACWEADIHTKYPPFTVTQDRSGNPLFYNKPEVKIELYGTGSDTHKLRLMLELSGSASCGEENLDGNFKYDIYDDGEDVETYECDNLDDVKVYVLGRDFNKTAMYNYKDEYYSGFRFYDEVEQQEKDPKYGYTVMRRLNGSQTIGPYAFSNQEVYDLYIYYLKTIFGKDIIDPDTCTADKPSQAYNSDTDTGKILTTAGWCDVHYAYTNDRQEEVTVFGSPNTDNTGRHYYYLDKKVKFSGLIEQLFEHVSFLEETGNLGSVSLLQVDENGNVPDPVVNLPPVSGDLEEGTPDPCYDSALNLGWLVCPLINNTSRAMRELYQGIIKDYLTIDSVLLTTGDQGSSGTYQAWSVFVGFANVLTIIFLLVVIFSQVTGVGIDNYGIKKALPKIIIAALLINLSFIICQLLADLSNIVGNSIENLLTNIGDSLTRQTTIQGSYASGEMFAHILDALLVAGGAAAIAGVVGAALSGGLPGLIIPLLIGLLVALAAILFFFVLLGLRKAAIVMLVAVSPIAFACYMLPNLKHQVFDKWFGLLKAMILIYPLCGFIIGGCNLASAILMSTGMEENFIFCFINMLLMVVPFFFLPTLIKKSMGALGNITSMASRAVRGGINRGGARARKWNEDRPINQQRRAIRADRREQRWANRMNRRFQDGTDSALTQIPGIGSAIKRRRDAMYGAAIQSAMKSQDAEAMRRALITNSAEVLKGSAAKARLDAERSVGEIKNYDDPDVAAGTRFLNQQAVQDQFDRNARFADKTAQAAYIGKMDVQRDKEAVEDANYATEESLLAAKQANLDNAVETAQGFWSSALQNGQIKGVDVNDRTSLRNALVGALDTANKATTREGRIEAMAQARAYQSALLRSDEGYAEVRAAYTSKNWGNNSLVRQMAAQLKNDNKSIKTKDRSLEKALQDVAENGVASGDYAGAGIDKITAETLSNCTQDYIKAAVDRGVKLQEAGKTNDSYLNELITLGKKYVSPNNTHQQSRVLDELSRLGITSNQAPNA